MLNPQDIYWGLSKQTHIHRKEDDLQGFLACKPKRDIICKDNNS